MAVVRWLLLVLAVLCLAIAPAEAGPRRGTPARHGALPGKADERPAKPAAKRAAPSPPPRPALSVGPPNDGKLVGGARLDTSSPHLRVVPAYLPGDVRWGLPALVSMIERAASGVARRYPGAVLEVGDLSRRGGGELVRHHSHESGRDVDLGFYLVDATGRSLRPPTFVRVDPSLQAAGPRGARFDVARNWALVELLLTDPRAGVTHIFVAEHVRQALLAHARKRGVSWPLRYRAALTLLQPTGAESHDDHMHVRIACPPSSQGRCVEISRDAPMGAKSRPAHARLPRRRASGPTRKPAPMPLSALAPAPHPAPVPVNVDDLLAPKSAPSKPTPDPSPSPYD
ncbi:MAG: penicillin-insensitive murein endopeptidase [Polyangiaceae bacterium]